MLLVFCFVYFSQYIFHLIVKSTSLQVSFGNCQTIYKFKIHIFTFPIFKESLALGVGTPILGNGTWEVPR